MPLVYIWYFNGISTFGIDTIHDNSNLVDNYTFLHYTSREKSTSPCRYPAQRSDIQGGLSSVGEHTLTGTYVVDNIN